MYSEKFKTQNSLTSHGNNDRRNFQGRDHRDSRGRPGGTQMSNAFSAVLGASHQVRSDVMSRSKNLASYMAFFKLSVMDLAAKLETSIDRLEWLLAGKDPIDDGVAMYYEEVLNLEPGWLDRGGDLSAAVKDSTPAAISVEPAPVLAKTNALHALPQEAPISPKIVLLSDGRSVPAAVRHDSPTKSETATVDAGSPNPADAPSTETAPLDGFSGTRLAVRAANLAALCSAPQMRHLLERVSGRRTELFENLLACRTFLSDDLVAEFNEKLGFPLNWFDEPRDKDSVEAQNGRIFNSSGEIRDEFSSLASRKSRMIPAQPAIAMVENAAVAHSFNEEVHMETTALSGQAVSAKSTVHADIVDVGRMMDQNLSAVAQDTAPVGTLQVDPAVTPKRRGRPPGSKTKPKELAALVETQTLSTKKVAGAVATLPSPPASKIQQNATDSSSAAAQPVRRGRPRKILPAPAVEISPVASHKSVVGADRAVIEDARVTLESAQAQMSRALSASREIHPEAPVAIPNSTGFMGSESAQRRMDETATFTIRAPDISKRPLASVASKDFAQKIEMMSEQMALKVLTALSGV